MHVPQDVQMFQPHPLLTGAYNKAQGHAISIDRIGSRMGRTEEFSDFECGIVIGCHLLNK